MHKKQLMNQEKKLKFTKSKIILIQLLLYTQSHRKEQLLYPPFLEKLIRETLQIKNI
jgi:hypothetical protein